jgi:hypothetical protein
MGALVMLAVLAIVSGAGAATRYIITSTSQIKPGVLRQLHGAQGPQGPQGAQGPQGVAGAAGLLPTTTEVTSPTLTLPAGTNSDQIGGSSWQANCPAGDQVIGTGFDDGGIGQVGFVEAFGTFVGGIIFNETGVADSGVQLQAICGPIPGVAGIASARSVQEARYDAYLRRAKELHR